MSVVRTNQSKPRRTVRGKIAAQIDLTVTPPATSYNANPVAGSIVAGELIYKTANAKIASLSTAGATNANAASCVGVADDNYPIVFADGISGSTVPPNDPNVPMVQIIEDGDHLFNTTNGDTYHAYDPVYLGADGRTIQATASGTSVGYISPDQRQSAGLAVQPVAMPIAGGAGVQVYVHITPALAK